MQSAATLSDLAPPRRRGDLPMAPAEPSPAAPSPEPSPVEAPPGAASEAGGGGLAVAPWVTTTYFAQGLPYSIVHQVAAQLFTALGASYEAVGLTSLYGLAWNAKFAWGPVVDRFGTTRRWLLGTQAALGLGVLALAWPAGSGNLGAVAWLLVGVSLLAATHDIAIDGFYLRALDAKRQASLSGLRVPAYRLALLFGNGVLVALAGVTSWWWCFAAASAALFTLLALHARILPAEGAAAFPGATPAEKKTFLAAFSTFFAQPAAAASIAFIVLFRAGDALMFAMAQPLLKELGLGTTERGVVNGGFGTVASIVGAMVGGALIARRGLGRTLFPIAAVQSAAILLYAGLALARPPLWAIASVVVVEQLVAGFGTAAFLVFIMRRCAGEYKASHFAFATALMSLATTAAGTASGYLVAAVGFPLFFVLAFTASLPGVALARVVPKA